MADKQKGLRRPQAPVDLFTLRPEEELVPEIVEEQAEEDKAEEKRPGRFKTSVELTSEALDLVTRLKAEYRQQHQKHLALWRILDEAVKMYAAQKIKNT